MQQNCVLAHKLIVSAVETVETAKDKSGIWSGEGFKPLAVITGKISEADIVNANGFLIPLNEWHDMLNSAENQERLKLGKMLCLVAHDERPVNDLDVRQGLISHVITDMWIDGKDVFMTANVCDTQAGRDLMGVIGAGGYIQASTRLGIVPRRDDSTGADCLVGKDSIIYGVDLVLDPAIESTWLEFKAASKENSTQGNQISCINKDDISTLQVSQNLEEALIEVQNAMNYELELNKILKGE